MARTQQPSSRQVCCFTETTLSNHLQSESIDDEFLLGRILFLMTYGTTLDYAQLVQVNHLADNINAAVLRHAKRYSKSVQQPAQKHTQPMDLMALCETLKLIFNITHFYPALVAHFSPSTPHVFKILTRRPTPPKPLDAPVNTLVNALLNLVREEDSQTSAFPSFDPSCNADHLITVLDSAIQTYPPAEMDTTISPLLTLLRHMHELAPPPVKTAMRARLLPSDAEREQPLGQSDTLPSRLLSLSASASTPMDRESISAFLFELSDSDAATFVHNVGYGYASGFLLSQNIAMPDSAMQGRAVEDAAGARVPVNPITGQRLDREADEPLEEMTQEEKEREAERLFVLFERLRATGVVDVENPITRAYQEGRITEIDSDDE
jgi:hypothetical protein